MEDWITRFPNPSPPKAKGRVERLFGTLQDRLVKELRLNKISTIEKANEFLEKTFISQFNQKFSVAADKRGDLHRAPSQKELDNLESVFSIQKTRVVNNDFTVQFENQWYQLDKVQPALVCRKDAVLIEKRLTGDTKIRLRGKYLNYQVLPKRPEKTKPIKVIALCRTASSSKPSADHPWRKQFNASVLKRKIAETAILNNT